MSRAQERSGIDDPTRIRLLETDADQIEKVVEHNKGTVRTEILALRQEWQQEMSAVKAEMRDGFKRCEDDSDGLRRLLTGLLVAIVTTSITIVATVLITAGSVG